MSFDLNGRQTQKTWSSFGDQVPVHRLRTTSGVGTLCGQPRMDAGRRRESRSDRSPRTEASFWVCRLSDVDPEQMGRPTRTLPR
jgi:hypothetical protein